MLASRILPGTVSCAEAFSDPPDVVLFPAEERFIAGAVDKRRREFATGRKCARDALGALGIEPVPIPPGQGGAPRWPAGVAGSITHCAGYRGAAVARTAEIAAIGLDAEPDDELPEGVLDVIALPGERARLRALSAAMPGVHWDRLLFSAKESVYKAWFPLTGRWLGFEEVDVSIDRVAGSFAARLLVPGLVVGGSALDTLTGRWLADRGLLLTAIAVAAAGSQSGYAVS
jgi:4'-phosphopantetheinyl transferase EntD